MEMSSVFLLEIQIKILPSYLINKSRKLAYAIYSPYSSGQATNSLYLSPGAGKIDDVRIYSRVLTAKEAMWLYKSCEVDAPFYFDTYKCPCVAGYLTVNGACVACEKGKFGTFGASACTNCSAGAYSNVTAASACTTCPSNTFSGATGSNEASSCQACQANALSAAGSVSQAFCYCKSGYAHAAGMLTCKICDPGTYNSQLGRTACSNCSVGLYSVHYGAVGVETCLSCPLGQWSPEGSPSCKLCPLNSRAAAGSGSLNNCTCDTGYTGPNDGQCSACAAGQYKSVTGSSACVQCPAGMSSLQGASVCVCPPNQYASGDPLGTILATNYIASYSLEFRRTTSGSMPLGSP
jgi:hypothetical protein